MIMDRELQFVMTDYDEKEAASEWITQRTQAMFAIFPLTETMSVRSPETLEIRPLHINGAGF